VTHTMSTNNSSTTTPASAKNYTGRYATIAALIIGCIGAAAPAVAQMDLSSTAGVVAGVVAISAVLVKFLDGVQRYEARQDAHGGAPAPPIVEPELVATPAPAPPTADPEPDAEPPAPLPGELDDAPMLAADAEVADVPDPPTSNEILLVSEQLAVAPATTAATGNGAHVPLTEP
jgi:hypothetical protein